MKLAWTDDVVQEPYATSMHRPFSVGRDGKTAYERYVGRRADPPLQGSVNECGGCLCSHPTVVWPLQMNDLSKESTWDRWMDRIQYLLALPVAW